ARTWASDGSTHAAGPHRAGHGGPRVERAVRRVQGPDLRGAHVAQADGRRGLPGQEVGQGLLRLLVVRAIDLHVHLPVDEWLDQAIGPYLPATEAYFRASFPRTSIEAVAEEYASRDILG